MCLTTTKYGVNPMIPHKDARPRCTIEDCESPQAIIGCRKDGTPRYRKVCDNHHSKMTAAKHGLNYIVDITARRKGFSSTTEYTNTLHPYRKHRKKYCENIDGRLGYTCTTTIVHDVQLDTDHKDGNHLNNDPENLQTLCKCCHSYKGLVNGDHRSPGRKTRSKTTA